MNENKESLSRVLLLSDLNLDPLAGYLRNDTREPRLEVESGEFGQVIAPLLDPAHASWAGKPNHLIVWTQPQGVIPSFAPALSYERVLLEDLLAEVDAFSDALIRASENVSCILVMSWIAREATRGWGMTDLMHSHGIGRLLLEMNLRLANRLEGLPGIFVLDAGCWAQSLPSKVYNPKLWYMGKIPFSHAMLKLAVAECKAALHAITGGARRIILLDLDETLWGGIVGDVGWENLTLGGHDPHGEAFQDFQRRLKALKNRGIVLAVISKNEESIALEAMQEHPEMILHQNDFAGWRINWQDKAQNILDLLAEMNLGAQSAVFLDDNPVERARVREALPEVLVPEWPSDPMLYPEALAALCCFDNPNLTQEDSNRTEMYAQERARSSERKSAGSLEDWLGTLAITVEVEPLNEKNLRRACQLLNKTNQMNLASRRLSEAQFLEWASAEHRRAWTFRVSDRFGDSGISGIASLEQQEGVGKVVDFLLSCRVMGRKIEQTMLHTLVCHAELLELKVIQAQVIDTKKNKPCRDFWHHASGFEQDGEPLHYRWPADKPYPRPDQIQLLESGT